MWVHQGNRGGLVETGEVRKVCLTVCDSMDYAIHGISRQEYWSGLSFPPSGDLLNPGIKPMSLGLVGGSLPLVLP